jgi:F0F1-type ATP synthase assembly protein I
MAQDPYHPGPPAASAEPVDHPAGPSAGRFDYRDDLKYKLGRMSALGFEFVISVLVVGAMGYAIDRWLRGGGNAFTLAGVILGVGLGMWRFIRDANTLNRPVGKGAPPGTSGR